METRTVVSVTETTSGSGRPCWTVLYEDAEGLFHSHTFPKETLEWRIAEYDLDPDDVDQLLDVVLHEPWLNDPEDPRHEDPAPPGLVAGIGRAGAPVTLFTAASIDDARTAHLARIAAAKQQVRIGGPTGPAADPLDVIRAHRPDGQRIEQMRGIVDRHRRRLAGEKIPRSRDDLMRGTR